VPVAGHCASNWIAPASAFKHVWSPSCFKHRVVRTIKNLPNHVGGVVIPARRGVAPAFCSTGRCPLNRASLQKASTSRHYEVLLPACWAYIARLHAEQDLRLEPEAGLVEVRLSVPFWATRQTHPNPTAFGC
jgi:hypothetical protein